MMEGRERKKRGEGRRGHNEMGRRGAKETVRVQGERDGGLSVDIDRQGGDQYGTGDKMALTYIRLRTYVHNR